MAFKRPKPSPANKALKARIRSGEKFVCPYCRERIPARKGTVDHVVPLSRWWTDDALNLAVCCSECNTRKSNLTLQEFLDGRKRPEWIRKPKLHKLEAAVVAAKQMHKRRKTEESSREIDITQAKAKIYFAFLF